MREGQLLAEIKNRKELKMRKGGKYYSPATKMVHWLMAIIIIGLLVVGTLLENMANGPEKFELMALHKSVGVLALFLFFLRIPLRIINPVRPVSGVPKSTQMVAGAVKGLLYLSMLLMPVSGILMSQSAGYSVAMFGWEIPTLVAENEQLNEIAGLTHGIVSKVLMALIALHVLGALYHHFIRRDETLRRMIRD
ncbi:cytochrome b561 [Thalassolituus maritimus]|jgi:cytochrome b561|uniref:Cytochrome b561 n=2 Tax=Thalassolituus maritimus TaxID=484498 RepID=A0A1N7MZH3_9GAMM|nr:cytochrome b561 [Thalassolituus maritimus]